MMAASPVTLSTVLETLPAWFGFGAGGGLSFFAVKWFVEWVGGRVDKREAAADAGMEKLIKHLQDQIDRQAGETARLVLRVATVEDELSECREQHAAARAEVMELRAKIQGFGDAKNAAAVIVANERLIDRKVAEIVDKSKAARES